jgi:hypothetical protein
MLVERDFVNHGIKPRRGDILVKWFINKFLNQLFYRNNGLSTYCPAGAFPHIIILLYQHIAPQGLVSLNNHSLLPTYRPAGACFSE